MGVSQRLHPSVGWGCIPRRSLTVTVGSASKMACSHGNRQEAWAPHRIDPPCLGALATWQLASPRVWDPKEQGRTHNAFYHLALEVVFCHFHEILLVTQASPLLGGRGLHGVRIPEALDHWGVTLKAGYHPSVCTEPGRYSWSISVWQVPTVSQHQAGLDTAPTPKGLYYSWKCKLETESGEASTS